ncbi:hypothetical protein CASFOL_024798 [Castilleja foliolosa]|uniref:Uncharacterized protein n=1 Tax=Castilleja foliolosa TaxID=1961234 RepID=A0ABD3CQL0_9LAMI
MGFRYLLKKIGKKRRICRNVGSGSCVLKRKGSRNVDDRAVDVEVCGVDDDLITSSNCTSTSRDLDLNLALPLPIDDVRDEDVIVDLNLAVPLPPIDDVRDEHLIVDLNLAVPLPPIDDVRDEDVIVDLNLAVPMPEAEAESEPTVNTEPEPVEDDGFDFSMTLDDDLLCGVDDLITSSNCTSRDLDLNLAVPLPPIDDVRDEDVIVDLNLAVPMPEAESEPVNAAVEDDDGFDFSMTLDDDLSWDYQFSLAGIPMDLLHTVWT